MRVCELFLLHGALLLRCARIANSLRIDPHRIAAVNWHDGRRGHHYIRFTVPADKAAMLTCVAGDGEQCYMKQTLHEGSVVISRWIGRIGNNLHQIVYAIFMAKLSGMERVMPPRGGPISKLFDLPKSITIEPDSDFRARASCSSLNHQYYYVQCTGATRADYTRVLQEYLVPHLNSESRDACKQEASNSERELVVHLRSGDLLTKYIGQPMAPCSFFDALINRENGFRRVRVITEPDLRHPCLQSIAKTGVNTTVQSESLAADACALMHADHLAIGADSTFSGALSWFNTRPVTIYDPFGKCRRPRRAEERICPSGKRSMYCIPGIRTGRTGQDPVDWMLNYNSSLIRKDVEQCF